MRHAYLTLASIEQAFRDGGITLKEANELIHQVERCREFISTTLP